MLATEPCTGDTVELDDVEVRTPAGDQLVDPLDLLLEPGDTLVITGRSGSGKTTLLRSLAQLWPYCSGTLRRPDGANETMFLSQLPYVPLGDLRAVVSYPASPGDIPDADCSGRWPMWRWAISSFGSTRCRTGPRSSPPASSSVSRSPASCSPNRKRSSSTRPRRHSMKVWNSRCTSCCEPGCRHHRRQRQPPPHRRAASRTASGASRRGRVAARPGGRRRTRSGLTFRWRNRAGQFPAWKRSRRPSIGATRSSRRHCGWPERGRSARYASLSR